MLCELRWQEGAGASPGETPGLFYQYILIHFANALYGEVSKSKKRCGIGGGKQCPWGGLGCVRSSVVGKALQILTAEEGKLSAQHL